MIPHGRTETGKLVISRSEISDGMRRINASQDRMLNRRLETIERQERTAEANHKKTVKRAVGDHDQKPHHQQSRGGATVDFPRREADTRLIPTQRGVSLDLAQYDAIRKSRSRGQSLRFRGQQRPPPPPEQQGAETKGIQPTEPSQAGHRWNGLDASVKVEGFESGGGKTLSSSSRTAGGTLDAGGRSGVSRSPLTQGSLAVANGQRSTGTSPSPSRPR